MTLSIGITGNLASEVCYRSYRDQAKPFSAAIGSTKNNPEGKFLVMVRIYGEVPELEGDRYVVATDGPDALLGIPNEMQPIKASSTS